MSLAGNSNLIITNWQSPPSEPMELMQDWVSQAQKVSISEPLGMTLTTVSQFGCPRSRVVLIKELGNSKIIFGSSSLSEKGQDIKRNFWVSGSLWWRESIQQIIFRGFATIASSEKSQQLFAERSREAQAVALASQQSQILESESNLIKEFEILKNSKQALKRPSAWNAYAIVPIEYEFWQGDPSRLHKRLRYRLQIPGLDFSQISNPDELDLSKGKWIQQRLQP